MISPSPRHAIETIVGRTFLRIPDRALRAFAGPPIVREGRTLDLQAQAAIRAAAIAGKKPSWRMSVAEARADIEVSGRQLGPHVRGVAREERTLAGRPARLYRPHGARSRGALLYFHGGGFVIGSIDSHDLACAELAELAGCAVVSADYRLAPEHRFPAAADDATAIFRALARDAEGLGVDPQRIAVGGDSAGGNLSAVVALDTRADATRPCFQMLIYPAVDMTQSFPSVRTMGEGFMLEKKMMDWFLEHYLGPDADRRHPRASPWFADDVSGLPPALVVTAGFDPLRDEGDAYAKKLREGGVKVDHRSYEGMFHGFWNTTGVIRAARRALVESAEVLRAALA